MPALAPDRAYPDRQDRSIRPSWAANPDYLDDQHRRIFDETKDIPGWQAEGDSYKLYEMAYFAGDVILELGVFGGRSAVVELRGALANPARIKRPQFFGLDVDPEAIQRSYGTLKAFGLQDHAILYQGDLQAFMADFSIRPTMVFVDADHRYEGVKKDLDTLSGLLAPGVPVLLHDWSNPENDRGEYGVRQASQEWEDSGHVTFQGSFGCSGFFLTTSRCSGPEPRMPDADFAERRDALLRAYRLLPALPGLGSAASERDRAEALRRELDRVYKSWSWRLGRRLTGNAASALRALRLRR
jgi:hypothetical protein